MVGLIDCDNFFCSCERVFRPDLVRRPVVVLSNNDGCVVARSREVKEMGIHDCMPYYQLMERYPDAGIVAFSSNYTLYGDMSARVMAILREEVPEVIQYSIDEAFLDLGGMERIDLKHWGEALCRKVTRGTGIPVSLGIASTKTLAKVASKFAKKYPAYNKCCVIGSEEQRTKALQLIDVDTVWGIGRRMSAVLERFGITTAHDFASQPKEWIRARFHVTGERTWDELNGRSVIELDSMEAVSKKTIVTSRSFPAMIADMEDLKSHLANHAARCAIKLRKQRSVCGMVTAFIQSNHFRDDLPQHDCSSTYRFLTPTNSTNEIVAAAMSVLPGMFRQGIRYKRAGVMVADITSGEAIQTDLFSFDPDRTRRYCNLSSALDQINGRFGCDTLVLGAQQYRQRDAEGKSIRFVNAIRRAMKSPDYSTSLGAFTIK